MSAKLAPLVRQKIEIPYSYAAGPAVGRFLVALKDKRFLASVCSGCGRRYVPPLSFCGRCWRPIEKFAEVGPEGVLESFAAAPQATKEAAAVLHYGLVRLEGATTLLAHFVLPSPGIRCGARVRPEWSEQRQASILDLAGFRVVE